MLNDDDESTDLKTHLQKWENTYRKGVVFYSYENPPKPFPLTGFYPLYSDEMNQILDKEIDDLIASTDLYVPPSRICLSGDHKLHLNLSTIDKCVVVKPNEPSDMKLDSSFWAIAQGVASRQVIFI